MSKLTQARLKNRLLSKAGTKKLYKLIAEKGLKNI